ncbi:PspC domain-containing protein [Lentilactobacillus fungorum]|jgi:phage shock protein PspC (stress-responsive transcriptional regulator)|uniref:PspC domain-containing protein n=1 Tax=Lentilactobacillus fungorum TaxID=2201250 RepID=A0ABQ3VWU3_9LACO|nr:PspC domain-containing protein [Lentilactobacillus fungorum]GHP12661.1 PspC domain-containing protein [Lentilactobacillus fungorum]
MKIHIQRSNDDRIIAGVLGGISEHFNWSPTLVRVLFVILGLTPLVPGIIIYLVLWILMEDPS